MFQRTIGILGGMGPLASAHTYVLLTQLCQQTYGAVQDSEFPRILLHSLPLKNFTQHGFSENANEQAELVARLKEALQHLEQAGAELILIDCNTVHYFFKDLEASLTVPLINVVSISSEHVIEKAYKKLGILSSRCSKTVGLYAQGLSKTGVALLESSETEQALLDDIILAVMAGQTTSKHATQLQTIIERLRQSGAEAVLLACTEIAHLAKTLPSSTVLIDSLGLAIARTLVLAK